MHSPVCPDLFRFLAGICIEINGLNLYTRNTCCISLQSNEILILPVPTGDNQRRNGREVAVAIRDSLFSLRAPYSGRPFVSTRIYSTRTRRAITGAGIVTRMDTRFHRRRRKMRPRHYRALSISKIRDLARVDLPDGERRERRPRRAESRTIVVTETTNDRLALERGAPAGQSKRSSVLDHNWGERGTCLKQASNNFPQCDYVRQSSHTACHNVD